MADYALAGDTDRGILVELRRSLRLAPLRSVERKVLKVAMPFGWERGAVSCARIQNGRRHHSDTMVTAVT